MVPYPIRKIAILILGLILVLNGIKSLLFPPESKKVFVLDVIGMFGGAFLIYTFYPMVEGERPGLI